MSTGFRSARLPAPPTGTGHQSGGTNHGFARALATWRRFPYPLGFLAPGRRFVYYALARRFQAALEQFIRRRYNVSADVAVSRPPHLEMGEIASPVCLQLAKQLKRAPRQIAEEIRA